MGLEIKSVINDISKLAFPDLYTSLRQQHPSLSEVDSDLLQEIHNSIDAIEKNNRTSRYIILTLTLLIIYATFPILVEKGYVLAKQWQLQLLAIVKSDNFITKGTGVSLSLLMLTIAIPTYTLIGPNNLFIKLMDKTDKDNKTFDIKKTKLSFICYSGLLNYLLLLFCLLYSYKYLAVADNIYKLLLIVWLMVPVLAVAFLPAVLLILIASMIVRPRWQLPHDDESATVIVHLARLLKLLDHIENCRINIIQNNKRIIMSIEYISAKMRGVYRRYALSDGVSLWSIEQMDKAADNFISLSSWVYFPQSNTLANLKDKICFYLNIFVSGNFHDLPRESIDQYEEIIRTRQKKRIIRRFIIFLSLAIYMGLPLLIISVLTILLKIEIPNTIHTSLTILYIIWAILGLISFLESVTPDVKDILFDTIKAVIGKK